MLRARSIIHAPEHEYLRRFVDPVLMPLIESLLLYQPESIYEFIHDYVDDQKTARFTRRPRSVGYAKKLSNRRKMVDFMSTSVIPVMDDLARQILREKPSSVQVITAIDDAENGTFTVLYDDGKTESNVHFLCLKLQSLSDAAKEEPEDNQEPPKLRAMDVVLLIIGIDGAGKTTLLSTLQGDLGKEHVPSAGFTSVTFQTETGSATFYDLGGGPAFRNVWKEYYADSAEILAGSMANDLMTNKPLLIFANKRDHVDAVTEQEMADLLRLRQYPKAKVVSCIAKPAVNSGQVDERLEPGLQWLFDQVHNDFDALNDRVRRDLELKKKSDLQRREEQRARVSRYKEERELVQMALHDKPLTPEHSNDAVTSKAPAESPEEVVIYCYNCSTEPAVTKCAASKWMPVCGDCASALRNQ
ncbi:hypothetical protein BBJ28_00015101 [Nothophytophthora sp. Chile5]|nr:hypothetical protein BBJ28_00015101 [Nothophytophthora sp. Chile5]